MSLLSTSIDIDTVKVFVTSLGNYFMIEIAQIFVEGFKSNGIVSELAVNKIPEVKPREGLVQIVVAPHEFFNLFLDYKLSQQEVIEVSKAVYMLSAEQPCTHWFEMAYERSKYSKGILDITRQTTKEYSKRGILSIHTPLGYAFCLEEGTIGHDVPKEVDILFLGSHSPKRELFLSRNADFFNGYNTNIIMTRLEKPKFENTAGFYANHKRNDLLKSSKILINIHSIDNTYFEWLRILMVIANRCMVISETSDHIEPLINGKHLVVTELENMTSACKYYLENDEERKQIVDHAYEFVTQSFHAGLLCKQLLEELTNKCNKKIKGGIFTESWKTWSL